METSKLIGVLGMLSLLIVAGCSIYSNYDYPEPVQYDYQGNTMGLIMLKSLPMTEPRLPTEYDSYTGIKLKDGDNIYSLYQSRSFSEEDLGKNFFVLNN